MRPNVPAAVIEYVKSLPEDERIRIYFVSNESNHEERWVLGPEGMEPPDWQWAVTVRGGGAANRSLLAQGSDRSPRTAIRTAILDGVTALERKIVERSQKMREHYTRCLNSLNALKAVVDAEWPEERDGNDR